MFLQRYVESVFQPFLVRTLSCIGVLATMFTFYRAHLDLFFAPDTGVENFCGHIIPTPAKEDRQQEHSQSCKRELLHTPNPMPSNLAVKAVVGTTREGSLQQSFVSYPRGVPFCGVPPHPTKSISNIPRVLIPIIIYPASCQSYLSFLGDTE